MDNKEFLITNIKTALKTVTPWKRRAYDNNLKENYDYIWGWNDCIKEIKKNRRKFIKMLENIKG